MLVCLALAGCGAAPATDSRAVDLGAEFTLAPGETVFVKAAEMNVRFVAVTEDSRCPADVTCIWAGEVKVSLEIRESSQAVSQVEISAGAGSTVAGGYSVTVARVEPQPVSTTRIAPGDYRVTLKIEKQGEH